MCATGIGRRCIGGWTTTEGAARRDTGGVEGEWGRGGRSGWRKGQKGGVVACCKVSLILAENGGWGNLKFKGAIRPAPKRPSLLVPTLPATFAVRSCAPLAVEYSSRDLAGDPALIARTVDNVKGEGTARGTHPRTFLARA
jgi:hypothetical protein